MQYITWAVDHWLQITAIVSAAITVIQEVRHRTSVKPGLEQLAADVAKLLAAAATPPPNLPASVLQLNKDNK